MIQLFCSIGMKVIANMSPSAYGFGAKILCNIPRSLLVFTLFKFLTNESDDKRQTAYSRGRM